MSKKTHIFIDGVEHGHCAHCDGWKVLDEFTKDKKALDGLCSYCRLCTRAIDKERRDRNPDRDKTPERIAYFKIYNVSEHRKKLVSKKRRQLKDQIIETYGGCCNNCGFSDKRALQIDHVEGNGNQERKKISPTALLHKIIRENYPKSYQILCANCNTIKMYENKEFPGWKSFAVGV